MAGSVPGFDAEDVRAGLRLAMNVGLPVATEDQPVFYGVPTVTNTTRADESSVPYDPASRRTVTAATGVRVPCAIEYFDNAGKIENFGVMVPTKVVLTLLDQDYAAIKGFNFVVIGGNRFFYQRTETPLALVSVGVYLIHCTAEDQT